MFTHEIVFKPVATHFSACPQQSACDRCRGAAAAHHHRCRCHDILPLDQPFLDYIQGFFLSFLVSSYTTPTHFLKWKLLYFLKKYSIFQLSVIKRLRRKKQKKWQELSRPVALHVPSGSNRGPGVVYPTKPNGEGSRAAIDLIPAEEIRSWLWKETFRKLVEWTISIRPESC